MIHKNLNNIKRKLSNLRGLSNKYDNHSHVTADRLEEVTSPWDAVRYIDIFDPGFYKEEDLDGTLSLYDADYKGTWLFDIKKLGKDVYAVDITNSSASRMGIESGPRKVSRQELVELIKNRPIYPSASGTGLYLKPTLNPKELDIWGDLK